MRMTRHGCFAASKEPKYVWYVYNFAYGIDESSATSGSFNGGYINANTISKMASTSFTANASGFTLTNPTSTKCNNLTAGQYLVNVSTSNSTATTGQYLYRVTNVTSSISIAVSYTRYSVAAMKGTTQVDTVSSDTMDYPIDGPQGDLWYVMVKGEKSMYVWDVFNLASSQEHVLTDQDRKTVSDEASENFYYSNEIEISNETSGTYAYITLINPSELKTSQFNSGNRPPSNLHSTLSGKYIVSGSNNSYSTPSGKVYAKDTEVGYNPTSTEYQSRNNFINFTCSNVYRAPLTTVSIKGNATGTTVESSNSTAYPQDGISGDKWYTYSHSYSKPFDNR